MKFGELRMNLEQLIAANTAALEANTAALLGGAAAGKTAAAKTGSAAGKTTAAKGPKHSVEQVHALVTKIGAEFGKEEARKVLKSSAGLAKLAEVTDANADKVFAAATAAYEELQSGAGETEGDDDDI
jgi:hypothetical protein